MFGNGSLRRIRPRIIILRVVLITRERQPGSFREVYLLNGNLLVPFFGSTENVCLSTVSGFTLFHDFDFLSS